MVHPGHILHLQKAKGLGDILVVTITASKYVLKGPGRPYFNDELRLMGLAALEMVDFVMLIDDETAIPAIKAVKPDFYVKGAEYSVSEDDTTGNIAPEITEVRLHGGDVKFTDGEVFSSTKLINRAFSVLPKEVVKISETLNKKYDIKYIKEYLDRFAEAKVLVVGDIIIDEYVNAQVQGLMSKDQAISTKYKGVNRYLGGSLAIANHLSGFSNKVTLCSRLGTEAEIHSDILNQLSDKIFLNLQYDKNSPTIIKRKYVSKSGAREEYTKIFAVNYLPNESNLKSVNKDAFYQKLEADIENNDLVIVCDYGHGLIDEYAMDMLQTKSKFLCLNVQTNSSNYGLNLITKYKKANMFSLDEKEMNLAMRDDITSRDTLLSELKTMLYADYGFVTLGSLGAKAINKDNNIVTYPALTLNVKDTIGAGDSFFSMVSVCSFLGMPIEISNLLGNCAGAITANVVSNSEAINKAKILKFASTVLNV
jgi:bifunctional ADP-heptose synthase (sugar kinase/adenylyltransferase)